MQPHNGCGLKVGVTTRVKEPPFQISWICPWPGVGKVGGTGETWGDKGNCLGEKLKTDVSGFGIKNVKLRSIFS